MWLILDLQNWPCVCVDACVLPQWCSLPGRQEVQGQEAGAAGHQSPEAAPNLEGCAFLRCHMAPSARVHSEKQAHSLTLTKLLRGCRCAGLRWAPCVPQAGDAYFVDTCPLHSGSPEDSKLPSRGVSALLPPARPISRGKRGCFSQQGRALFTPLVVSLLCVNETLFLLGRLILSIYYV